LSSKEILSITAEILSTNRVLILGHIMPDGDDISSVASLYLGLKKLDKEVRCSIDYDIPSYYKEFPGVSAIENYESTCDYDPELIVVVDSSSPDRVGRFADKLKLFKTIVIDHHATNTMYGNLNWVDESSASCAQMIYILNNSMGVEYDRELALANYLGIATDTGFFKYSNTDYRVFQVASQLVKLGAEPHFVSTTILENKTLEQLQLLSTMINNIKVECDGQLVYSHLTYDDYVLHRCSEDASSGFVSELRSVKTAEAAVLFSEFPQGEIHVSMRSKRWLDVSAIAFTLGGGGHPRAAGCSFSGYNIEYVIDEVIPLLKSSLRDELKG